MHLVFALDAPTHERQQFEGACSKLGWAQLRELKLYHLIFDRTNELEGYRMLAPMVRKPDTLKQEFGVDIIRRALALDKPIPGAYLLQDRYSVKELPPTMCGRREFPCNIVLIGTRPDARFTNSHGDEMDAL